MFNDTQLERLRGKLSPEAVRTRSQSGRSLSYIEGWWAIHEANEIFGYDAWTRELLELRLVHEGTRPGKEGGIMNAVTYIARVRIVVNGTVVREGCGTGHGIDRDLGQAHESASKEAETDAMKRALMTFGNPFGLALYDKSQANVGYDEPAVPAREPENKGALKDAKSAMQLATGLTGDELKELWGTYAPYLGLVEAAEAVRESGVQGKDAVVEVLNKMMAKVKP